jgi:hypothetical protein
MFGPRSSWIELAQQSRASTLQIGLNIFFEMNFLFDTVNDGMWVVQDMGFYLNTGFKLSMWMIKGEKCKGSGLEVINKDFELELT